jgi:hypothetical protein
LDAFGGFHILPEADEIFVVEIGYERISNHLGFHFVAMRAPGGVTHVQNGLVFGPGHFQDVGQMAFTKIDLVLRHRGKRQKQQQEE